MKALSPLLNIGHCTVTILRMPGLPAQPTIGTILQPTSLQGLVGCILFLSFRHNLSPRIMLRKKREREPFYLWTLSRLSV